MPTKDLTLMEMVEMFPTEDECHEFLAELRWPDGVVCPKCGSMSVSYLKKRRQYDCNEKECRKRFSVRAGTIFNDSHLPIRKWFMAVYLMVQSKKGISANQLKRMLGVSYKTAWYLCHRIRESMKVEDERQLTGIVEGDETFLGGKRRGVGSGFLGNKEVVLGLVERGGEVRLKHKPNRRAPVVHAFVDKHLSPEAEALYSDAYKAWKKAARKKGVKHGDVRHFRHEWVNGQIHSNTIEGVFSLLDRSIIGAYHKVSKKHLHRYLEEVEWRYNNRDNPYLFRDTLMELIGCERLEYKELTA